MSGFVDEAQLHVKAGDGGAGAVAFRREAHVARGGPDGGDGGRGGSVWLVASTNQSSLLGFRDHPHRRAGNGGHGGGKKKHGARGADLEVAVPVGTRVRSQDGTLLADLAGAGERWLAGEGGHGGHGNARFLSNRRRAPAFAEQGERGHEEWYDLELALSADVALIGFPNVGKSMLIARISAARPAIADYPFTTLEPHLGVVRFDDADFVVADIPGLVEGAAEGKGLGHRFLRHITRARVLAVLVDLAPSAPAEPADQLRILLDELARYQPELLDRPRLVVGSRADLAEPAPARPTVTGPELDLRLSSVTGAGVPELLGRLATLVAGAREVEPSAEPSLVVHHRLLGEDIEVERVGEGAFVVHGRAAERAVALNDVTTDEAAAVVEARLRRLGVDRSLVARGRPRRRSRHHRRAVLRVVSRPTDPYRQSGRPAAPVVSAAPAEAGSRARTLVVKLGSSSVTTASGGVDAAAVEKLAAEVAAAREEGQQPVVVTSGAIAAGWSILSEGRPRPTDPVTLQAVSAVGQHRLMQVWADAFARRGLDAGQVLLAPLDFVHRSQYLHARRTLSRLLELGIVPVVNENDAVADEEIRFGDNDRLAALVAHLVGADLLVLLTDTAGLLTEDPGRSDDGSLIEEVVEIDHELERIAGGPGSADGSGGMGSKLAAAKIAVWSGVEAVIADATRPGVLGDVVRGGARYRDALPPEGEATAGTQALDRLRDRLVGDHRGRCRRAPRAGRRGPVAAACGRGVDGRALRRRRRGRDRRPRWCGLRQGAGPPAVLGRDGLGGAPIGTAHRRGARGGGAPRRPGRSRLGLRRGQYAGGMPSTPGTDLAELGRRAKDAGRRLAASSTAARDEALTRAAELLEERCGELLAANELDCDRATSGGVDATSIDRLRLDGDRVAGMVAGLRSLASLPDPIGEIVDGWVRPNGLRVSRVRVPLGVVGIIYENRPNVTSDAAGLCLKSANAVLLRGSSSAVASNAVIAAVLRDGLDKAGLPTGAVGLVEDTSRESAVAFMQLEGVIDCLVPRGGPSLVASVREHATVPYVIDGAGNCHVYVDAAADLAMAEAIVVNAKTHRPGVCNAAETLLVHRSVADRFLPRVAAAMPGVELVGDQATRAILPGAGTASEQDYATEFLGMKLAVAVVDDLDGAIGHVTRFSSGHSEAIVTGDLRAAERFTTEVDAAAVVVNASTRLVDGEQLGLGAEIGISTQKLHARGPMGVRELTSVKFVVTGDGQVRR